jgi:hypothetical protein
MPLLFVEIKGSLKPGRLFDEGNACDAWNKGLVITIGYKPVTGL